MNAPLNTPLDPTDPSVDYLAPAAGGVAPPESNPIAGLLRLMRGRWLAWAGLCLVLAPSLAV
ncbi:MAG: hypothetical protein AAGD47_11050, partial [Pseudomonadota bacterium]